MASNNDKVPELTNGEFEEFIKKGVVLVDFFAEWCMPCVMMAPVIEDLSETFKGKIKFAKVNVGDAPEIAEKFDVSSIPNLIVFKDGKVVSRMIGAQSADDLEDKLREFL